MKASILTLFSAVTLSSGYIPGVQHTKTSFQLNGIFEKVAGMDLFAPNPTVNTYGARSKKKLTRGKITDKSYVPAGLTAEQYTKLRKAEDKKKADNYARNVKKAGIFGDYTEFYRKRGTDSDEAWSKSVTKGHTMAKTKYDWSGSEDNPQQAGLTAKKKVTTKKKNF